MPIIKDGALIEDSWTLLDEEADVPSSADIIIPLNVMLEKAERLSNHSGRIGLLIGNDVAVEDHADLIAKADIVVLELPAFTDGRAYSQARDLREDLGFEKELRVKGDVLVDQAAYLLRCGFDSFDVDGEFDAEAWEKSTSIITTGYQRTYKDKLETRG
jgi:uncharacterized protein (DUF934 family)